MATGVRRKIDLAQQLTEQRLTVDEPPRAATSRAADARLEARKAILATLQFNQQHEQLFRVWMAERKGTGTQFRMIRGQLHWRSGDMPWSAIDEDSANVFLARFDIPEQEGT